MGTSMVNCCMKFVLCGFVFVLCSLKIKLKHWKHFGEMYRIWKASFSNKLFHIVLIKFSMMQLLANVYYGIKVLAESINVAKYFEPIYNRQLV